MTLREFCDVVARLRVRAATFGFDDRARYVYELEHITQTVMMEHHGWMFCFLPDTAAIGPDAERLLAALARWMEEKK